MEHYIHLIAKAYFISGTILYSFGLLLVVSVKKGKLKDYTFEAGWSATLYLAAYVLSILIAFGS